MTLSHTPSVRPVALAHAYRLLNTGASVLIATAHDGQRNLMACAWNMPLDFLPAKLAVCIDKNTFTRGLLEASGEFAVAVPSAAQAALMATVGTVSGRDSPGHDKFKTYGIAHFAASQIGAPLVTGCIGWLECRVIPTPAVQDAHDLFIAEVVAAWADERGFVDGKFRPLDDTPAEWRTLHHLGAGNFVVPGRQLHAEALNAQA